MVRLHTMLVHLFCALLLVMLGACQAESGKGSRASINSLDQAADGVAGAGDEDSDEDGDLDEDGDSDENGADDEGDSDDDSDEAAGDSDEADADEGDSDEEGDD